MWSWFKWKIEMNSTPNQLIWMNWICNIGISLYPNLTNKVILALVILVFLMDFKWILVKSKKAENSLFGIKIIWPKWLIRIESMTTYLTYSMCRKAKKWMQSISICGLMIMTIVYILHESDFDWIHNRMNSIWMLLYMPFVMEIVTKE